MVHGHMLSPTLIYCKDKISKNVTDSISISLQQTGERSVACSFTQGPLFRARPSYVSLRSAACGTGSRCAALRDEDGRTFQENAIKKAIDKHYATK